MAVARKDAADRQVAAKRSALVAAQAQQAAGRAQTTKADVRLLIPSLARRSPGLSTSARPNWAKWCSPVSPS